MINESQPSHALRVFLCYSSDDKPSVQDLYKRLSDDGFMPWLDVEDLLPGQDWDQTIAKAVRGSDVVAVCLSLNSVNKRGYVQKEIGFALDIADEQPEETIFIIPLKLEECDVPARLKRWQWVNLFEDKGYDRLLRALRYRAAADSQPLSKSGSETNRNIPKVVTHRVQPAPSIKRFIISKKLLLIAMMLIVGLVTLAVSYWVFIDKSSQATTNNNFQYTGRVVDSDTQQVIRGAKVSIESQGVPQVYYTDTDGVFFAQLSNAIEAVRIRVEAAGYEVFERNVSVSKTRIEDIRLVSNAATSRPTPTPEVVPVATPSPVTRPSQRRHQPEGEDPALDILRGKKKDGNLNQRNP